MKLVIGLAILLCSCGAEENLPKGAISPIEVKSDDPTRGETGATGATGATGVTGATGASGSSCTVEDRDYGAEIVCTDGTHQPIYDAGQAPSDKSGTPTVQGDSNLPGGEVGPPVQQWTADPTADFSDSTAMYSWKLVSREALRGNLTCPEGYALASSSDVTLAFLRGIHEALNLDCSWANDVNYGIQLQCNKEPLHQISDEVAATFTAPLLCLRRG